MVTMAQRIEQLRGERGLSRPALSAALGFAKNAVEKFETGRQTPTKEQQDKLADFFGVSLFYLRGESSDRTRQDSWMEGGFDDEPGHVPMAPAPKRAAPQPAQPQGEGNLFDALLAGRQFKQAVQDTVLEVLRSPEGQELLAKAIRRELLKTGGK